LDSKTSAARPAYGRRKWLAGLGLGAAGIGVGLAYRAAPGFWRQFARDLGRPVDPSPHRPDPARWPNRGLHAAWLGHASVLLKIDGFTILTDPVFSTWIGLGLGPFTLGFKRMVEPALAPDALSGVDLILLSHAHMDHMDLPSLRALENKRVPVVTARGTSDLLRQDRYRSVQELGWGEQTRVGPLQIKAMEVRHWGARMRTDTWRGYNGYILQLGRYRVVFAGDTAITDTFRQVGGADLALMPIGAYNPWIRNHCNPEQAWLMANQARAEFVLPVHHRTFSLSSEPWAEPLDRLLTAAHSSPNRIVGHDIGREFHLT